MNTALWILQGLLALAFIASGAPKLVGGKAKLVNNPQMSWSEDFSDGTIRLVGLAEVLGGLGLILPPVFQLWEVLTPIAAVGLALVMLGAVWVHMRRKEAFIPALALALLAGFIAVGRFGISPF